MVTIKARGSFDKTKRFLKKASQLDISSILEKYALYGVKALSDATPKESGETANSWGYEIKAQRGNCAIYWTNSHFNKGVPIAIILQYGHGTGTGGYVQGRDYINPAIRPVFDDILNRVWKEVTT